MLGFCTFRPWQWTISPRLPLQRMTTRRRHLSKNYQKTLGWSNCVLLTGSLQQRLWPRRPFRLHKNKQQSSMKRATKARHVGITVNNSGLCHLYQDTYMKERNCDFWPSFMQWWSCLYTTDATWRKPLASWPWQRSMAQKAGWMMPCEWPRRACKQ